MSKVENILWTVFHPLKAMVAKGRQLAVSIEHAQSPGGSNMEDFPGLPVKRAAKLLKRPRSGVPLEAWPERDQSLMRAGKPPVLGDHPEHPNV